MPYPYPHQQAHPEKQPRVFLPPAAPHTFPQYSLCILIFIFSAFYEEILYRMYLPAVLSKFLNLNFSTRVSASTGEILSIVVFAFSHRYLGYYAVLNAAAAALFLRICYKKSGSIFPGTAAHFLYNIMMLSFAVHSATPAV